MKKLTKKENKKNLKEKNKKTKITKMTLILIIVFNPKENLSLLKKLKVFFTSNLRKNRRTQS
jgi:hypothetical protein